MKHFIIGTAGHVDHGKTSLIKAMTGIDTDRLKEEKKRGITIDLGFAYVDLPHFPKVGIVDVPGHERFIKNMLAGAGGIDLVMLIVAADEGVMPQTREHLDIMTMLDMKVGCVVITKVDLVEPDFMDLVEDDVRAEIAGTFLQDAPVFRVSSYTGEGIPPLMEYLDTTLLAQREKDTKKAFRLPIDRAFTMSGFGTVVTGTVIEGQLSMTDNCVLYPDEIPVKLRNIQVHSQSAAQAFAGQRAAVNISNMRKEDIKRGYVLAPAGSMDPTMMLDVRLDVLRDSPYPVQNNSKVHFYHGSAELLAKVVLMDRDALEAGESCYAQLRFEEHLAAKKGDMFVIRFYSPLVTIGGGMILDPAPARRRRNQEAVTQAMEVKEKGSDQEQLYQTITEYKREFLTLPELTRRGSLNRQCVKNDRNALLKEGRIIELQGEVYVSDQSESQLLERAVDMLKAYHAERPLEEGMQIQEFRNKLLGEGRKKDADAILAYWKEQKKLKENDNCVSLYNFFVERKEDDLKLIETIETIYRDAGFTLPLFSDVAAQFEGNRRFKPIFVTMLKEGRIIKLDEKYYIHKDWYEKAKTAVVELGHEKTEITLGEYRDKIDSSRKVALALLDYFDQQRATKKRGDVRVLFWA